MNDQKLSRIKRFGIFFILVIAVLSFSGCQTIEQIRNIDKMEREIEELKQERDQLKQTYSEAQQFITQASRAGGFDNTSEFIDAMFETKEIIEKTQETINVFEANVDDIINTSKDDIEQTRKISIDEISTMLKGFELKFEDAVDELDEIVRTADSKFSVSMNGLQQSLEDYKRETDTRVNVFIKGINSEIETIKSEQREWRENEKVELLEKIENLRTELTTLAIGRDSILARMERRVDILAKSMEEVAQELQE